jgi:putative transcriptional regulator
MSKQYRSRVMASVHETAEGLSAAGVMSKQTMREFEELCLTHWCARRRRIKFTICAGGKGRA